jgi:hypothetical protein
MLKHKKKKQPQLLMLKHKKSKPLPNDFGLPEEEGKNSNLEWGDTNLFEENIREIAEKGD